jgi:hypothetical protein
VRVALRGVFLASGLTKYCYCSFLPPLGIQSSSSYVSLTFTLTTHCLPHWLLLSVSSGWYQSPALHFLHITSSAILVMMKAKSRWGRELKSSLCWVPVAHACNPNYSGGRDQEDCSLKTFPGKQFCKILSQKTLHKNRRWSDSSCKPWVQVPVLQKKKVVFIETKCCNSEEQHRKGWGRVLPAAHILS